MTLKAYQIRWKSGAVDTCYGMSWDHVCADYHINDQDMDCYFVIDHHNALNLKWMKTNMQDTIKARVLANRVEYTVQKDTHAWIESEKSPLIQANFTPSVGGE